MVQCENLPVIQYEVIDCKLPEVEFCDLSTDQTYLYKICLAISSGQCSADLANQSSGKINHSSSLKELTTFILRVYVFCKNVTNHVWQT